MDEEYGKIRKQILTDIADAIRFHKDTTMEYKPEDFAKLIRAMAVIPSGIATSELAGLSFGGTAVGVLPTVYTGRASSALAGLSFDSTAVGELTE